jgi:predicted nucleic acid-binding protein
MRRENETFERAPDRNRAASWDALIVIAAVRGGAERIISEDLQHGVTISGVRIENPFRR